MSNLNFEEERALGIENREMGENIHVPFCSQPLLADTIINHVHAASLMDQDLFTSFRVLFKSMRSCLPSEQEV